MRRRVGWWTARPGPPCRRQEDGLNASVGDHIEIASAKLDPARRRGEIVEVVGTGDAQHYRVRWQDGHESVHLPGSDARLSESR